MNLYLIVAVIVALVLLGAALWLFLAAGSDARSRKMRSRLEAVSDVPDSVRAIRKTLDVPVIGTLYRLLWRGGMEIEPAALIRWCLLMAVIAALLLLILGVLRGFVVIGIILLVGFFVIARRAARRRAKIVDQLPGFLENVVRILTAGNTLEEAFANSARENPEPIRTLFTGVSRQVRLGAPLEVVLNEAGDIYRLRDLKVIGLAVNVNRRYGGSIRNVFRSLVQAIRQRGTAAKELRALTAETRFSAMILAFVSIGLFAYVYLRNPAYYAQMLTTSGGQIALGLSFGLLVAGSVIIWRMTNLIGDPDE